MKPPAQPTESGTLPLPTSCYLYRAFDGQGDLLYIGITEDLCSRMARHRHEAPWFRQADRITWELYVDRPTAEYAETYWIRHLYPKHNRTGNGRRIAAEVMGHRRLYDPMAWRRLGEVIRADRVDMRRTQKGVAKDARIDVAVFRSLERGEATSYERPVLESMERAMCWHPGSLEAVLAGGEPNRLSEAELVERAHAEHAALALGDRL